MRYSDSVGGFAMPALDSQIGALMKEAQAKASKLHAEMVLGVGDIKTNGERAAAIVAFLEAADL